MNNFKFNNDHLDILKEGNYVNSEKNEKEISKEMAIYDKLTWKENSRNKKNSKKKGVRPSNDYFDDTADNIFLYKKLRKLQRYSNRVPQGRYKRKLKITKNTEVFNRPGMFMRKPVDRGSLGTFDMSAEFFDYEMGWLDNLGVAPPKKTVDCTTLPKQASEIEIITFNYDEENLSKNGRESLKNA